MSLKRSGFKRATTEQVDRARDRQRASAQKYEQSRQGKFRDVAISAKPRKPLPPVNRERIKKRREEAFGPQAEECRHLPCCVCHPWMYTAEFVALEHRSPARISDPHHVVKRPAGKDSDTIPLGMAFDCAHHDRCSSVGSSEAAVEAEAKRGQGYFRYVAKLIARELRGNIDDGEDELEGEE